MSITKEELVRCIETIAPKELMESWDNTGIQLDVGHREINRILVCLDICSETIEEAIEEDCEYIISHHPLMFSPIQRVSKEDAVGRYLIKLIRNNISVYSSHTSFDSTAGGNNDFLAEKLGLREVDTPEEEPVMRAGILPEPVSLGCDVLVTGDVKYHEFQRAEQLGIALIDAGHYETEIFFNENMAEKLQQALGGSARVIPSKTQPNCLKKFAGMV